MMKEQIDKEIRSLQEKKKKLKERDREISEQKADLNLQLKNQELFSFEVNFNLFYEKKRRDIVNLQTLNEFVKPNPYFLYYMFKDTIHVDDYGSIKETLFKFPTLNKVAKLYFNSYLERVIEPLQDPTVWRRCELQDFAKLRR